MGSKKKQLFETLKLNPLLIALNFEIALSEKKKKKIRNKKKLKKQNKKLDNKKRGKKDKKNGILWMFQRNALKNPFWLDSLRLLYADEGQY